MMKLNPDRDKVREVGAKIKANDGFCPCMTEQNDDTFCPCKDKREKEICVCGLYVKREKIVVDKK